MEKKHYNTYGNVAYAPERRESREPTPQRAPRTRPANLTRTRVQVREKDAIAPFAIFGFLAVCVLAGLLMTSYAHLTTTADRVVQLRSQLGQLESEQASLSAQYEKLFDINSIEDAIGSTLMRPGSDQVLYLDLSQADNVTIYSQQQQGDHFFATLKDIILEFFA